MPAWTKEDDERIRELAAKGASAVRIAGALNRKIQPIRTRARFLGCALPSRAHQRQMLKPTE